MNLKSTNEINEFTENLFNTVREPLLVLDKDLNVINANLSFYNFFKVTPAETITKCIYDLGNNQWNIPKLRELLETILPEKKIFYDYEVEHYFSTIGKRILLFNARQIEKAPGKESIILLAFEDITDDKKADESLSESHKFIEEIINSIPVRVFWKDSNLNYLGCNNIFARDAGFTNPEEIIGKDDFQMAWRDQAELYRDDDRKVIETGRPKLLIEEPQTTPEGKTIALLTSKIPLRDSADKIVGMLGTYMDITERKLTEAKLQESEEKYRELVEASPDGIIIQRDGKIVFANRSSIYLMRASSIDELIGKSVIDFVHPSYKEIVISKMIEMKKTGKELSFGEEKLLRLDGSEVDVEVKAIPIVYDKNPAVQIIVRDITERKQIESALKTSEERFRTAAENLTDVVYESDMKQKLDWYGDIDGITGYPPGGFPRTIEGWEAVIHPEDKQSTITALENHIKGEAPYSTEYRIKRSDGGWRWWSARGTALMDDLGKPYKMIGSITDITEQKEIQNKIKFNSELLSHVGQAVIATDLQGKVIYWNNAAEEIYGWSSDEAIGQNIVELTPTELAKGQAKEIMNELRDGNSRSEELLVKRKDGSIFPAYITDSPIIDSNGKIIGIIGISSDISERKQAAEALSNERSLLRTIIDLIPDAIYAVDIKGRKILANAKEIELSGKNSEDEIIGKTDFDLYPESEAQRYYEEDQIIFQSGKPTLDMEDTLISKDGQTHWILGSKVPLRDVHGQITGIVGVNHDITERKRSEEKLRESNEQLIKLNAEKDKFFSIIAHDLKSPFNGFLNLTALMADTNEKISVDEFTQYSKMLNKSASNIYVLLNNLLEWAQIQRGTIQFTPTEFDLSKLISRGIDTISQRAQQKQIEIINEISNSQKVYADEKMIDTILRNLLSNAVKFTRTGGKIIVKSKRFDGGTIQVLIEDNGVGISEDIVKKLFRIDQKVRSIGTDGEPSTGLGLLLCKEFVEMHGQKIWAESEKNKGSTFCFTLKEEN